MQNKRQLLIIITYLLLFSYSCIFDSYFCKISKGFEVGYVDLERCTNIYYKSQGIFHRMQVLSYGYDQTYIWSKVVDYDENTCYYLINMDGYIKNPYQLDSDAVEGPYCNFDEFNSLMAKKGIKKAKWTVVSK
ncbi:MAG: hypothetical protein K1X26_11160 [Chitinophagales bacterium]|nr:hypothetical protein [Chitinophagales bacterium]